MDPRLRETICMQIANHAGQACVHVTQRPGASVGRLRLVSSWDHPY